MAPPVCITWKSTKKIPRRTDEVATFHFLVPANIVYAIRMPTHWECTIAAGEIVHVHDLEAVKKLDKYYRHSVVGDPPNEELVESDPYTETNGW